MATHNPTRERLFHAAGELRDPAQRVAFLDAACGHDQRLRAEIEDLLRHDDEAGSFLDKPAASGQSTEDYQPITERPGTVIGPYKLMEQIGEGGMGLVFVAEQQAPVRRKVALKIIKPGMDSKQVIARFEAERQALAMMDHQNIAKVFDAGTTESGRPYFVMELVHGTPITTYCDENKLTPRERLELFLPVCHAIQHAHQKGIIHRDVKPSNILVTMYDDKPVPKVIDFGVAKAIEQRLTEKTVYTQFGMLVGTFEYMSPEQAEMNAFGVDTRSDIYSLGVLLYELLTGSTPLERKRLREAAFDEIRRLIKEEEPPRPSVRLSTSGALAKVAAARQTDPAKLSRLVRGELDWVVMRCLEKDRTRRYETANGLARDVERYLKDESVEACPPSAGYRLRKFTRKHKKPLAVAGAFGALLLVAFALVVWKWQGERTARADADAARLDALAKAWEIQDAADRMNAANAALDLGGLYAHHGNWAAAQAEYDRAAGLRPEHAQVWIRRGDMYSRLGLWDLVAADYHRAFELHKPETPQHWYCQALLQLVREDGSAYRRVCGDMLHQFRETIDRLIRPGATPTAYPESVTRFGLVRACALAPAAVPEYEVLLRLAEPDSGPTNADSWVPLYVRGAVCYRAGRLDEAVQCLRAALSYPNRDAMAMAFPVLAMALHRQGQTDAARQELENARQALDQWSQAAFRNADGSHRVPYWYDWVECQVLYREAHAQIEPPPPPEDPRLRVVRGRAFAALGWHDRADAEFATAVRLAPDDPPIRSAYFGFHVARGRWREAEAELAALVRLSPDDPKVHLDAFRAYADRKQWDRATAAHAEAIRLRPHDLQIRLERVRYHADRGEQAEADKACAEVASRGENDGDFRIKLGDACAELKLWSQARTQYARAIDLGTSIGNIWYCHALLQLYFGDQDGYRRTYASLMDRYGKDPEPDHARFLSILGYLAADPGVNPARALEMAEITAKQSPKDGEARLGIALVRAGRYDDALSVLTRVYARGSGDTTKMFLALVHYQKGDVESARSLMGQIPSAYRQVNPSADTPWHWTLEGQILYRDAEAVIQTKRWSEVIGLAKQQPAETNRALEKLLPAGPRHVSDWVRRGLYYVQLGQWDKAARDYDEAIRHGANSPEEHWHVYAQLCRRAGRRDDYQRACAEMLARFGHTENPRTAYHTVAACQHAIGPNDLDRLLSVVDRNAGLVGVRGHLLYRQGQFEAAAQHLEKPIKAPVWGHFTLNKLFLAMTYQRLGRGEEARALLAQESSWIDQHWTSISGLAMQQEFRMLREEAEELILRKPAAPRP
jgi:serine/threonine protein kinase/Tfp pilus assembly protein PilF